MKYNVSISLCVGDIFQLLVSVINICENNWTTNEQKRFLHKDMII